MVLYATRRKGKDNTLSLRFQRVDFANSTRCLFNPLQTQNPDERKEDSNATGRKWKKYVTRVHYIIKIPSNANYNQINWYDTNGNGWQDATEERTACKINVGTFSTYL